MKKLFFIVLVLVVNYKSICQTIIDNDAPCPKAILENVATKPPGFYFDED